MTRYRSRTQSWMIEAINSAWVPGPCDASSANRGGVRSAVHRLGFASFPVLGERDECRGELVDARAKLRGQGRLDAETANRATQQAQHRVREQVEVGSRGRRRRGPPGAGVSAVARDARSLLQ
jgi:hypothetical protein